MLHAEMLKPSTGHKNRHQKTKRSKQANAAISLGIEGPALTHQMCHGGFTHGHHRTGEREHRKEHKPQTNGAKVDEQKACTNKCHAGTITQQLYALSCLVTEPTPSIGSKQARSSLHRGQNADSN